MGRITSRAGGNPTALESRGPRTGGGLSTRMGGGFLSKSLARRAPTPAVDLANYIRIRARKTKFAPLGSQGTLGISLFLVVLLLICNFLCTSCVQYLRHNLVVNRSKFLFLEDTRPAAGE